MNGTERLLRRAVRETTEVELPPWDEIERAGARLRRRRRRVLPLAGAAVALAAALLLVVGGVPGGSTRSPLERARAAVSSWPPGHVLHTIERTVSHFDQPVRVEETWQLTSPPYTRHVVSWFDDGKAADRSELVVDGDGRGAVYDWRSNEVVTTDAVGPDWRETRVSEQARDEIQGWIDNIHATSLGESDLEGHRVVGYTAFGTLRIYLDASTFLPVLSQSFGMGQGEYRRGYDTHYRFELLDDAPANRALLDLTATHPGATVRSVSGEAWRTVVNELGGLMRPTVVPGG